MAGQGPGRPPNINDLVRNTNGSPQYLGTIVSTGAVQNNATTATPFNQTPLGPSNTPVTSPPSNLTNTLAGKTLLLQSSAAGLIQPATNASVIANQATPSLVALQTVVPPVLGTAPGVSLASGERVVVVMQTTEGWLQWLPVSGSANLLVWELV